MEYLQIESDQVDNEDMGYIDAPRGRSRGVVVSWNNCIGGKLRLLKSNVRLHFMAHHQFMAQFCNFTIKYV